MTFKEAYTSGKNFRPKGTLYWLRRGALPWSCEPADGSAPCGKYISIEEAIGDWEVEEVYYPVTEKEMWVLAAEGRKIRDNPGAIVERIKARGPVK